MLAGTRTREAVQDEAGAEDAGMSLGRSVLLVTQFDLTFAFRI
jgi:hypothetical protein